MNRKAEADQYYALNSSGFSQAMSDQLHNHAYPGANRGSQFINPSQLNDQKNALAKEAHKFGLNPWKDLPGYN
jgi:hypothetical protein